MSEGISPDASALQPALGRLTLRGWEDGEEEGGREEREGTKRRAHGADGLRDALWLDGKTRQEVVNGPFRGSSPDVC